ncbi:MFS transporter [Acrocarpospora phusangensis]|uniref:MFS transporter n=1 Tax=Acrocarpospora phusangensis TaxID=1070424 RepID=A0A919QF71_9ACTN|nr:MFS transporter [Acrocarpospora phusangensis]GIH26694.1 MFS transporter [Acrocarpospora phusangensis]
MYLSTLGRTRSADGSRGAVGGTVLALGAVSLVTDVSAEMITAVLPLYLVIGLQFSPAAYGLIDGLYTGATVLLRLAGGHLADRISRHKAVAGAGYLLSALAKLGLLAAGTSAPLIGLAITADRAGKGLRTAPRDALITLTEPPERLGTAFGVHRTMDATGAFLGPLAAVGVLALAGGAFGPVFLASFCVALLGVLILALFVQDVRLPAPRERKPALSQWREALAPARSRLLPAACLLGLATVGDGFVFLLLQRRTDLGLGWFPLLAVGTSLAYLLLAAPLGRLADRFGRLRVMISGHACLVAVYLLLDGPLGGWPLLVLIPLLYGTFYAATDGILMAMAGAVLPPELRATGLALIQSGQALSYLVSSVLFGLAWQAWGPGPACLAAAAAAAVVLPVAVLLLRRKP